ncbi:MAG: glycosyltransferase [Flavobacteriaceae bacterium]|nr:glycosyltransferase [Flavobacteriaceae bacterium]
MKVLHVINSLVAAGAENLVVTMANGQINTVDVSIFTFYSEKDVFHTELDKRVELHRNKGSRYFSLGKMRRLNRLISKHDVVHVHLFPPLYIVAFLSIFHRKTKFVYTEHNTHNARRKPLFRLLEGMVYSRYDKIVCITEGVSTELKKWIKRADTVVINNVIDKKRIDASPAHDRSDFGLVETDKILVMIGRMHKQKDQDTLLRAMTLLPSHYKLLLIGEGPRDNEVRELSTSLNLDDRVQFLGIRTDVFSIIKMCDFGVLSSHWEGFGIVALEYMACKVITLGSNVEGLSEVIKPKKALFQQGNEIQLAELIQEVESNSQLHSTILKEQQEQIVNFEIETSLRKHFEVYREK